MGRPLGTRTGPPVVIYVGAFARLRDKLASLDDRKAMQDVPLPEPSILRTITDLFIESCKLYPTEADRKNAVPPLLEKLLDVNSSRRHPISPGEKLAEFDAVNTIDVDGAVQAYTLIVEVKNELGISGASGVQCAFIYEQAVALPRYQLIRNPPCCPSILLAVAGPYLCFYGAILADTFVVQPFTDYIYLGGDPNPDARIVHTARRFLAFREAIREARSYFRGLHQDIPGPPRAARLPCPTYTTSSDAIRNLHHVDRSLFSAELNDEAVLVKFCTRYGADAHRYLAGRNLAPVLRHCIKLVGQVTMVVMDVVEDAASAYYKYINRDLPKSLVDKVEEVVKALHDEEYVHGDIHRPNIMVREGDTLSVMLMDFDWAGKAGKTHYPVSLNLSGNIAWATGTEAGGLIVMGHDDHMVEMLRKGGK
ncbi:hypothetical protein BD309DRAFT_994806 [Dichomitus squalens]|uniref:Uncharacterized protein n=1 Tax=Dichomitus squalens TaxID=114155 RepID=A0A4V2K2T0_9APHY|nr:hypothetical protein BD309DRAFT_994806 [Dichomitus squalens]TBU52318.1 hypothetical protein BD310DRAFT_962656 [Dichomitus squalens]